MREIFVSSFVFSPPPQQQASAKARASSNSSINAAVAGATPPGATGKDKDRDEITSLLFDMKHSVSHGTKYEPPPRTDQPPLAKHHYEYEVREPYSLILCLRVGLTWRLLLSHDTRVLVLVGVVCVG